ncbi:hypothetical protein EGT74_27035 [Chitinophaga lutea]|uniref:Uncharacterized protein n=1 Tax=Chitinophaga lutea TaxID=2488634 RepID=A0A3N4PCP5_9BACT|nr:PQQ-binding-like beta-propeller repeat protein [Chitinophaga lutea]RPE06006.1 hypothetical protein EGT74_27035 [Chitinophaga lutea]
MIRLSRLLLLAGICSVQAAAAQYSGYVFSDDNKNGLREPREKGIAGVRVSDGLNVLVTDSDGAFTLPGHARNRFVFITTPAGYRTTKAFYMPLSPKTEAYNFGLQPVQQNGTFLRITDTETAQFDNWVTDVKQYARNEKADFLIHTGDICYEKGMNFHAAQVNTQTMDLPVYYAIGNHDLVKGAYGEELYESLFGPVFYSFESGKVHYIVTPMRSGDYKPSYTDEDVYQWLKNDLAKADPAKPVVIFNHDLLTYDSTFRFKDLVLNEHRLKAWIYGHWHINFSRMHGQNGVRSICAAPAAGGGIDNSACNFDVFSTDGSGITDIRRRYTYAHRKLAMLYAAGRDVTVNAYHTASPVKSVTVRTFDQKGNALQVLSLTPQSDWNWRGGQLHAKAHTAATEALLNNGEILFTRDTIGNTRLVASGNLKGNIWRSAPVSGDNLVFIATIDDELNRHCGISAMDFNGKVKWQFRTRNSVKNMLSYANGTVLGTDAEGYTYAVDAKTGRLKWEHQGGLNSLPEYCSGGIVDGDSYYTGAGKYLQALSIKDGSVKWTNTGWAGGEGTPATIVQQGNLLAVSSNWNALFMHEASTGKLLWKKNNAGIRFRSSTPVFADGELIVCGTEFIHFLDPQTGRTKDSIPVSDGIKTMAAPVVTPQHIIVSGAAEGLVAFDRTTHNEAWRFKPGEAIFYSAPYSKPSSATIESTPLFVNGRLYAAALDGRLYVLDAQTGKVLQQEDVGCPIFAPVAREGQLTLLSDFAGNVYFFKL